MTDLHAAISITAGEDRASHHWLVAERHKYVALWISAATNDANKDEAKRLFAIALALDSAIKAIEAHHPPETAPEQIPARKYKINRDGTQPIGKVEAGSPPS